MQAFAGTALYLFLPENVRLAACNFSVKLQLFCAVRAITCWDWLWLFFVSSKQCFCPYKTLFTIFK
jgi:hypothetical protein